ncbi:Uncharacterised protein [Vibrio cholerae]|nr:Uncharacterised protein [Vibrio cholerae]
MQCVANRISRILVSDQSTLDQFMIESIRFTLFQYQ